MTDPDSPRGPELQQDLVILPDSGADIASVQETVIERRPSSMPRLAVYAMLAAALAVAALVVAWVRSDDPPVASSAATTTTTTSEPSATTATTMPRPPRTTLPQPIALDGSVGDLPPARPAAELIGTLAEHPSGDAAGALYQLDLLTGAVRYVPLPGLPHSLMDLDGTIVAGIGRQVLRVDTRSGDVVVIADDVSEVLPAYNPPGIVAVVRGAEYLLARVVGPDGVFRSAVQMPNEAVVHGALGDHVVVSMAGSVMALDGRNDALQLGAGRVLAVGDNHVVRLQCEEYGCQITDTSFSATVSLDRRGDWCSEVCAEASGSFGAAGGQAGQAERAQDCATICASYPIATGAISERRVELPATLLGATADRWSEQGQMSPDGNRIALRLMHGGGASFGIVVIDLSQDWSRHSPEIGVGLGHLAWGPNSRFLLYTFDDDVMVWDVEAAQGERPSGRAHLSEPLGRIVLR
ncbi:hypothetical protein [Candidatus Poriferisodalis sp.]|uniref:hypothetical protein n=1 Tax=Candidatus Poriferisodalis sp. TaxID=3101277 RepID=UPI003B01A16F